MESREQIEQVLINCLLELAPNEAPDSIEDNMNVLKEWGLESDDGVDLAIDLGLRLGIKIPLRDNPLIEEKGGRKRARSFREVVDYLGKLLSLEIPR